MSNSESGLPERPKDHWIVRRRTMYVCIVLMILISIAIATVAWFNPKAVESMGVLIGWLYGALSVPVIGFYSNTAVEEYAKNRKM